MEEINFSALEQEFASDSTELLPPSPIQIITAGSQDPIQAAIDAQRYIEGHSPEARRFLANEAVFELTSKFMVSKFANAAARLTIEDTFNEDRSAQPEHMQQLLYHLDRGYTTHLVGRLAPPEAHNYRIKDVDQSLASIALRLHSVILENPTGERDISKFASDQYFTIPASAIKEYLIKEKS